MKKIFLSLAVVSLAVVLAGCGNQAGTSGGVSDAASTAGGEQKTIKGDVGDDTCKYFTADFVYSATGKPVVKVEPDWIMPLQACRYYFTYDPNFNPDMTDPRLRGGGQLIFMMVENLSVENQKKGLEMLGATYKSEPRIKMENMATYRTNGSLRDIRLIINPNRYVRIETNSGKSGISEEELIQFAIKVAEKIQGKLSFDIKGNPLELPEEKPVDLGASQQPAAEQFINFLKENKFSDAVAMMDASDQTKQMWLTNFQTIKSLKVKKVEEAFKDEWTQQRQTFKFTLEVSVTDAGEQLGWENGTNVRWITLQKTGDQWLVHELANNP